MPAFLEGALVSIITSNFLVAPRGFRCRTKTPTAVIPMVHTVFVGPAPVTMGSTLIAVIEDLISFLCPLKLGSQLPLPLGTQSLWLGKSLTCWLAPCLLHFLFI